MSILPTRPDLDEYPFESRYLDRPGGLKLHYIDQGRGRPVIMVHGNPTWSFFWRHLINALSPDCRCLVPDHMGMGLSSRPTAAEYGFRLADRAADLAALADHWDLDQPAHLIMHDWGGPIGLTWAAAHPDKVASLTILNSGIRVPSGYRLPWKLAAFKLFSPLGDLMARRLNLFVQGTALFGVNRPLSAAARRGFIAPYEKSEDRLAVAKFVADIPLSPDHPSARLLAETDLALEKVLADKPLGLVWGLRDFVFNRTVFLDWRERFPKAPALVLPEAGHYLMEDEPGRVCGHLKHYLASLE